MDKSKLRKTIIVALFVSLASQIRFNFMVDGFIIALSVMVMTIFIYCYTDLSAIYVSILSGIFSPLFRLLVTLYQGYGLQYSVAHILPDMVFFLSYGVFFSLIYKYIIRKPRSMNNFLYVIFFCDILSNLMEITARSLIVGSNLLEISLVAYLCVIAFVRTSLIMTVIVAIEYYSKILLRQEYEEQYRRLLRQASTIEDEIRVMEKNVTEVEEVMKKAYSLYQEMKDEKFPTSVSDKVLDIAKDTHEIKGDYTNVLSVIRETYLSDVRDEEISIKNIILLEKSNVEAMIRSKGYNISVKVKIDSDFYIRDSFKMMSIIRNLLINSVEAISDKGNIRVDVREIVENNRELYAISVLDDGNGISKEDYDNIFLEGYTTKFDVKTGNIMRGLGLCLVKDYVTNNFGGNLEIESEPGKFTNFKIMLPKKLYECQQTE